MTALHLLPPSVTDPHYSRHPLTYSSDCFGFFNWPDSFLASSVVNKTTMEVVDSKELNISVADATQWQIQGLEEGSLYRFLLSGCTRGGCGPPLAQESITIAQTRECQLWEEDFNQKNKLCGDTHTHTHCPKMSNTVNSALLYQHHRYFTTAQHEWSPKPRS